MEDEDVREVLAKTYLWFQSVVVDVLAEETSKREEVRVGVLQDEVAVSALEVHHLQLVGAAIHKVQAVFCGQVIKSINAHHPQSTGGFLWTGHQVNKRPPSTKYRRFSVDRSSSQ